MIAVKSKPLRNKRTESAKPRSSKKNREGGRNNHLAERAERLSVAPLRFVFSDEFDAPDAAEQIVANKRYDQPAEQPVPARRKSSSSGRMPNLARVTETPPLEPAQETELFRRLNYLKYEANCIRSEIDSDNPDAQQLEKAERYLESAAEVRDLLIRSNLRLVISIAKRFTKEDHLFEDLVSEGTIAVMNAVEHFDYQRRYRFSTYATQAVRRAYYRLLARRAKQQQPLGGTSTEMLDSLPGPSSSGVQQEAAVESLREKMRDILVVLDPREQQIITARFGMNDLEPGRTLQSIADQLGVCKERVRQLERRAFDKLRARAEELHLDEFVV